MPRGDEAKQRLRDEQRTHILAAARRVFARKGLTATMDDVATEAGVSHGLAYRYFANKETIVRTLIEQSLQAPSAHLQHVQELSGTPGERLAVLITAFVESRHKHSELYQLLDQVLHDETLPDDFQALICKRGQDLRDTLRQLIVEGQATGEVIADDPDQLATAIFACLDGLIRQALHDPACYRDHFPDAHIFLRMLKP